MPSESTPHRSRRRKDPKTSEKENITADAMKASRSRKLQRNDLVLKDCDNLDFSSKDTGKFEAIVKFTSSAPYWKRHTSLVECVFHASKLLCQESSSSLFLEEHASELLSTCRAYVKDATEEKNTTEALKLLYVATHGLRAICPTLSDPKKIEATMKILYHAITKTSDVCHKANELSTCVDATAQCLASFQALGLLLNKYKLQDTKLVSNIRFEWKMSSNSLFPIPAFEEGESGSTMTVKQVFKIALQAAFSVANSLTKVYTFHIKKTSGVTSVGDFGSYTFEILQQTLKKTGHEMVSRIVQEVTVPWSCFLSSNELATTENVEDSLTYSRRGFRILFDVASHYDKSIEESTLLSVCCLELRKQAILAFLLSSPHAKMSHKLQSAVKKYHWEGACTYAYKASLSYQKHKSNGERAGHDEYLDLFHKDIGAVLDSYAPASSLAYIEYAAFRALQVGHQSVEKTCCRAKTCVFGNLSFPFVHNDCITSSCSSHPSTETGQTVLAVVFLVICIRNQLDAFGYHVTKRNHTTIVETVELESLSDVIINRFRSVFGEPTQLPSSDVTSRCYRLLQALDLNRKVYQLLSNNTKGSHSSAQIMALDILGRVLSECIGPFALTLMGAVEEKKQQQLSEVAVDSFVRGLAVFDHVREWQLRMEEPIRSEIFDRAERTLRELFTICDENEVGSRPSEESLEKAAKTIFAIGRVRCDSKEYRQALLPLCYGVDLFSRLAEMRGPQSVHGLQLSMRYSHLSFTFSSLHMVDEACLALVLALVYDLVDSIVHLGAEADDDSIHLLCYLSSLTNGAVYMGTTSRSHGTRRALVSRLVRLYGSLTSTYSRRTPLLPANSEGKDSILLIRQLLRNSTGLTNELTVETLPASVIEEDAQTQFGLAVLLSSAFKDSKLLRSLKKNKMNALRREQLLTVAEVLAEHGSLLQHDPSAAKSEPVVQDILMKDFKRLLGFLESLNNSKFQEDPMSEVPLALIHVLAAASLIPNPVSDWFAISKLYTDNQVPSFSTNSCEGNVALSQARRLISKACGILAAALNTMKAAEDRLATCALIGCAVLYANMISADTPLILSASTKIVLLDSCREAIQLLSDETSTIHHETRKFFRLCLTRTLTRFQDIVNLEGDKLLAAQAAFLVFRLHEATGHVEKSWYQATASNLLQDGRFLSIASNIIGGHNRSNTYLTAGNAAQLQDLLLLEIVVSRQRLELSTLNAEAIDAAMREVEDMFKECCGVLGEPETEQFARVLLHWTCSSCALTLAEGFEYLGAPTRAVDYLRQGVNICRQSVTALRKLRNAFDSSRGDDDCLALLMETGLSAFQLRLTERRITGQQRMSIVYARLGDHRRSEAYAVGAAQNMLDGRDLAGQRLKIHELASFKRSAIHLICQSTSYRLLLEMKAKASPSDLVLESLRGGMTLNALSIETQSGDGSAIDVIAWQIDAIWNLLNAGDLYYMSRSYPDSRFKEYYRAAGNEMKALQTSPTAASLLSSFSAQECDARNAQAFASLQSEVQLRHVRLLLSEPSGRNESKARDLCIGITEAAVAKASCRAWAHYYVGLLLVKTARQTGALRQLWIKHTGDGKEDKSQTKGSQDGQQAIAMARYHLREALALIGPASDVLSRDAMRSLALLAGPLKREEAVGLSAAALLHSSIGATSRQVVSSVVATDEKQEEATGSTGTDSHPDRCSDERLYLLFDALDTGFSDLNKRNERINFLFTHASELLPTNWRVIAIALCPTGEILISSMGASTDQNNCSMPDIDTVCVFPNIDSDLILDSTVYNDLMKPLDTLIQLNEDQIRGLDVTVVADNFKEDTAKRDWWNARQSIDDELQSLIENTERKYFSSDCVRRIFLCSHFDDEDDVTISCGNLASRFEEACTIADGVMAEKNLDNCGYKTSRSNENCMLLILDENLHRFPFEGMELFSKWAVSRIPSLPFAFAPLLEFHSDDNESSGVSPLVNPIVASYIVDPEGNLSETKKRLVPAIEDICDKHGWNWDAVIGSLPSEDFVQNALTQRNGLLLYCGHGGATACFSRSQIEGLMKVSNGGEGKRRCRSTVILMGCSSGKLISVNRKESKTTDKVTIFYEPEGIALSYLCAGAPCVVGNLWDVTDRDIDRYCITLLDKFLGENEGHSLAKCVVEARSSCKMRHIVGLAPVCYGIPVHLLKH